MTTIDAGALDAGGAGPGGALPIAPLRPLRPPRMPAWLRACARPGFLLVALWYGALNFQTVTFTGAIADGAGGPALKLYHGLFAALGVLLLVRNRLVRWRPEMGVYFGVTTLTTLVAYFRFGPQPIVVNVIFAAYAATLGATLGAVAGTADALRALRATSLAVLVAVLVKDAAHVSEIVAFLAAPNGHPTLPTFFGGGPNLEATWVGMAGVFFIGSRLLLPYVLASAAISAAYASRVGLIVAVLVLAAAAASAVAARRARGVSVRRWLVAAAVAVGACAAALVTAANDVEGGSYVAQRFQSIGEDPGSVGRLTLWSGAVRVFAEHPLGVGQGNAVPMIERTIGADLPEDNLHNQYLQHLVETGFQGLAAYLLLAALTWRRVLAGRFQDHMLAYVSLYFVLALIQFRGAEALLWFVYGLRSGCDVAAAEPGAAGG